MKRLSQAEIKSHFSKSTQMLVQDRATLDASKALIDLSHAVNDLQRLDINVRAEVFYVPNRLAFSLSGAEKAILPFSGIIDVSGQQFLFGIATADGDKECLKLALSLHDIRFQGGSTTVDCAWFDLSNPDIGITELQKHLIDCHTRSNFVKECDPAGVFEINGVSAGMKKILKRKPESFSSGPNL